MYICNTKLCDVEKALKNMIESDTLDQLDHIADDKPQLIQVGIRKYESLKKAAVASVLAEIEKKKVTHLLNFRTMSVHRKDCSYAGKNVLRSYLTTAGTTGLHLCNRCRPW